MYVNKEMESKIVMGDNGEVILETSNRIVTLKPGVYTAKDLDKLWKMAPKKK